MNQDEADEQFNKVLDSLPNHEMREAVRIILRYGSTDGEHHKQWVMDQALRLLTSCPVMQVAAKDYRGRDYTYDALTPNDLYTNLIEASNFGEDGPDTYSWDEGIAP